MLWTKLGMGLLGMAGKGLTGSGLVQTLSQGLGGAGGGGGGGGCGRGMGKGMGGGSGKGMKGKGGGRGGMAGGQTDAPALDELLTRLLQRPATVDESLRPLLPATSAPVAGTTIDVEALPAAATAPVDRSELETAMRALLASIHHFTDGRVRLRHPLFRETQEFDGLRRLLCEGTAIDDASFNAVTGSALLTYDPDRLSREDFLHQALPLGACLAQWEARQA